MLNERVRPRQASEPKLLNKFSDKCALIKFAPDYNPAVLEYFLDEDYRGIIIEATGLGQINQSLWPAVERASKDGVFVGVVSQCTWGRVKRNLLC